jgi:hypothetical protein
VASAAIDPVVITYPSPDPDLNDLDHYYMYQWKINYTVPDGYEVKKASLTYYDIWDWTVETDHLYTHLLDTTYEIPGNGWSALSSGGNTWRKYDGQGGGDYFAGQGLLIGDWNDPVGGHSRSFNLTYDLNDTQLDSLNSFLLNGNNVAWGVDPDCHYYNCKVEFVMELEKETFPPPTPELSTWMLLACSGLAGALVLRRKK